MLVADIFRQIDNKSVETRESSIETKIATEYRAMYIMNLICTISFHTCYARTFLESLIKKKEML